MPLTPPPGGRPEPRGGRAWLGLFLALGLLPAAVFLGLRVLGDQSVGEAAVRTVMTVVVLVAALLLTARTRRRR